MASRRTPLARQGCRNRFGERPVEDHARASVDGWSASCAWSLRWRSLLPKSHTEGEASRIGSTDELTRVAEVWTHKWDGRWNYAVGDGVFHHRDGTEVLTGDIFVFRVKPTKILAFAKGAFSHTRHQF